ncbi:MAG: hypothetical protein ACJAZ2_002421 [Glaciecola sp.]|jgi:hypothetical protein
MNNRFQAFTGSNIARLKRVKDISISLPKIRAEFYVRLVSVLGYEPSIIDEGYEFYLKDKVSGKVFSAALTGFGPGYFAADKSEETLAIVEELHAIVFAPSLDLKDCKTEYEHDFGKTILGHENDEIIEIDIDEE